MVEAQDRGLGLVPGWFLVIEVKGLKLPGMKAHKAGGEKAQ